MKENFQHTRVHVRFRWRPVWKESRPWDIFAGLLETFGGRLNGKRRSKIKEKRGREKKNTISNWWPIPIYTRIRPSSDNVPVRRPTANRDEKKRTGHFMWSKVQYKRNCDGSILSTHTHLGINNVGPFFMASCYEAVDQATKKVSLGRERERAKLCA